MFRVIKYKIKANFRFAFLFNNIIFIRYFIISTFTIINLFMIYSIYISIELFLTLIIQCDIITNIEMGCLHAKSC